MVTLDVVVCTYNRAGDLDRCLEALARQRPAEADWRTTVVDNNCTDATADVVARHARAGRPPRLARIVETTQGLTPARQRGVRESGADWIAFVDDDCTLAPDWIAQATRFAALRPSAGAFGGRVILDWGRPPPPHLGRHGWLFAEQDPGDEPCEVQSLVGTGLVLNRGALTESGWTEEPLLADRIGASHVSGGDIEISLRLKAIGRQLWCTPAMRLDHHIDRARQGMASLLGLARGLGAGAELVNLLGTGDGEAWLKAGMRALEDEIARHRAALRYVPLGGYSWRDWLIRRAFLVGRREQRLALAGDREMLLRLAGTSAPRRGA